VRRPGRHLQRRNTLFSTRSLGHFARIGVSRSAAISGGLIDSLITGDITIAVDVPAADEARAMS